VPRLLPDSVVAGHTPPGLGRSDKTGVDQWPIARH
jgi:hypothetical protein